MTLTVRVRFERAGTMLEIEKIIANLTAKNGRLDFQFRLGDLLFKTLSIGTIITGNVYLVGR